MPYRRVRRGRVYKRKRSRVIRRRIRVSRPLRTPKFHSFKQNVELATIPVVAATNSFFNYIHAMVDMPQASQFLSLYDQYRLMAVRITFIPQYNSYQVGGTASTVPVIYTALDFDSATTPTQINTLDNYTTCRKQTFTRPHTRYYKPSPLLNTYISATTSGQANLSRKTWMNWNTSNVPYYGLIGAITAANPAALVAQSVRVMAVYYFQCRNVR